MYCNGTYIIILLIVSVLEKVLVIYKLLKPACTAAMNNWNVKELVFLQFDGFTCFQERRG